MNNEAIETKKNRIAAAAKSIGFVVRNISVEGKKTVITFKKDEKPRGTMESKSLLVNGIRR